MSPKLNYAEIKIELQLTQGEWREVVDAINLKWLQIKDETHISDNNVKHQEKRLKNSLNKIIKALGKKGILI